MLAAHEGALFACKLCESSFNRKLNLERHVENVHEGKKPYTCSTCGGSFAQKSGLKTHIASVHDGIKPKPRNRSKIIKKDTWLLMKIEFLSSIRKS